MKKYEALMWRFNFAGVLLKTCILFTFLLFLYQCTVSRDQHQQMSEHRTFFIDALNGNDNYSGVNETKAWQTFNQINQLELLPGDRIEISPGSFHQTLMLSGEGTVDAPIIVHFAKGRYDFYTDNVFKEKYNISNTNDSPDSLKAVGILLKQAKHVQISGEGAEIVYHGKMIEVCIDSSENIIISDLSFDYNRPTVSEFTVVDAGKDFADLKIHRDSEYKVQDDNMIWYGEGWQYTTGLLAQELDSTTGDVRRIGNPISGMRFEEISPGLVRAHGAHNVKIGLIYQLRETFRDYAAVFTRRSKNITWKNVNFYFLHGMGLVSQFSENQTFDKVSIAPDSTSGRTTAAWADCLHLSGCKGKILIKDCVFKGAHDDAINIHGTYLRVVEKISDIQLKIRFMHNQTYGFMAVNPGDEIDFVDGESYKSHGLRKVKESDLINSRELVLTLENPIPSEVDLKDIIENVTWIPEVEIRGCHVSWIPTRGLLISTRRKVLIEENEFLATHMSAILVMNDASNWYEAGFIRNMTIQNNKFIRCAEPVIKIDPRNEKANDHMHQNITIENNEFVLRNELMLKAKSTKNITIRGNTFISKKKLNKNIIMDTTDCLNVNVAQNKFLTSP